MSMTWEGQKTPGGKPYVRTVSAGDVTADDVQKLIKVISPGGEFADLPMLAVVSPGANYSAEARNGFTGMAGGTERPVAVVVSSAPMRVMLSFIIRLSDAVKMTKFFGTEDDARKWLVEQLDR
jgi:hypothetical protein